MRFSTRAAFGNVSAQYLTLGASLLAFIGTMFSKDVPWILRWGSLGLLIAVVAFDLYLYYRSRSVRHSGMKRFFPAFKDTEGVFEDVHHKFCYAGVAFSTARSAFKDWYAKNRSREVILLLTDPHDPEAVRRQAETECPAHGSLEAYESRIRSEVAATLDLLKTLGPTQVRLYFHKQRLDWWMYFLDDETMCVGLVRRGKEEVEDPLMVLRAESGTWNLFSYYKQQLDCILREATEVKLHAPPVDAARGMTAANVSARLVRDPDSKGRVDLLHEIEMARGGELGRIIEEFVLGEDFLEYGPSEDVREETLVFLSKDCCRNSPSRDVIEERLGRRIQTEPCNNVIEKCTRVYLDYYFSGKDGALLTEAMKIAYRRGIDDLPALCVKSLERRASGEALLKVFAQSARSEVREACLRGIAERRSPDLYAPLLKLLKQGRVAREEVWAFAATLEAVDEDNHFSRFANLESEKGISEEARNIISNYFNTHNVHQAAASATAASAGATA